MMRGRLALAALVMLALMAALVPQPASAATINMEDFVQCPDGSNWSSTACWDLGRAPETGDDVVYGSTFLQVPDQTTYDLGAGVQLHSVTVDSAVDGAVISGGPIVLQSGGFITINRSEPPATAFNTGFTLNGPATFTLSSGASSVTFGTNAITGTGPLTLVNDDSNDDLQLNIANTYTGATTVSGTGSVLASVNGSIPTGSAVTVNGILRFGTASTIGSLAGSGTVNMTGNNALTVGGDNTDTTFSGVYQDSSGAASLVKTGTGILTLSGANTYTGATTVSAGTLTVTGSTAAGTTITVESGATLGGTGTINGNVVLEDGATLSGSLTFNGDVNPLADDQSVSTNEDTAVVITLTGSDANSDPLTFSKVADPTQGTLGTITSVNSTAATVTYTPDANATGADSFTFEANDGGLDSPAATISITINAVNDAPIANAQAVTTDEDEDVDITLTGSDPVEGSALTFTVVTQPASGTLSGTAPNLTYTPDEDFNGADSFTFLVNDGTDNSTAATVSITVNAVEEDDDDDDRRSGGGGGRRVVVVNQQTGEPSVTVLPDSHFLEHPLDRIQVSNSLFLNTDGVGVSQARAGQQLSIAGTFANYQETEQDYAFIVQITDEDGSVVFIGWQQGTVASGQNAQVSTSWTPMEDGTYTAQIFVWDGLGQSPTPLSTVAVNNIEVEE